MVLVGVAIIVFMYKIKGGNKMQGQPQQDNDHVVRSVISIGDITLSSQDVKINELASLLLELFKQDTIKQYLNLKNIERQVDTSTAYLG